MELDRLCGPIACLGKEKGVCKVAQDIRSQADHGSNLPEGENVWKRQTWVNFIRNSSGALPHCAFPEQLRPALEIKPTFLEDLPKDS